MTPGIGKFVHVEKLTSFASRVDLTLELASGKKFPDGAAALFIKAAGTVVRVTFASGHVETFDHTTSDAYLEPFPTQYIAIETATDATEIWAAFN